MNSQQMIRRGGPKGVRPSRFSGSDAVVLRYGFGFRGGFARAPWRFGGGWRAAFWQCRKPRVDLGFNPSHPARAKLAAARKLARLLELPDVTVGEGYSR